MKLMEIDWNKMASGGQSQFRQTQKKPDHKSATISFTIGIDPRADEDEVQGEVDDLKLRIEEMIEYAKEDGTTLITGVHFHDG